MQRFLFRGRLREACFGLGASLCLRSSIGDDWVHKFSLSFASHPTRRAWAHINSLQPPIFLVKWQQTIFINRLNWEGAHIWQVLILIWNVKVFKGHFWLLVWLLLTQRLPAREHLVVLVRPGQVHVQCFSVCHWCIVISSSDALHREQVVSLPFTMVLDKQALGQVIVENLPCFILPLTFVWVLTLHRIVVFWLLSKSFLLLSDFLLFNFVRSLLDCDILFFLSAYETIVEFLAYAFLLLTNSHLDKVILNLHSWYYSEFLWRWCSLTISSSSAWRRCNSGPDLRLQSVVTILAFLVAVNAIVAIDTLRCFVKTVKVRAMIFSLSISVENGLRVRSMLVNVDQFSINIWWLVIWTDRWHIRRSGLPEFLLDSTAEIWRRLFQFSFECFLDAILLLFSTYWPCEPSLRGLERASLRILFRQAMLRCSLASQRCWQKAVSLLWVGPLTITFQLSLRQAMGRLHKRTGKGKSVLLNFGKFLPFDMFLDSPDIGIVLWLGRR